MTGARALTAAALLTGIFAGAYAQKQLYTEFLGTTEVFKTPVTSAAVNSSAKLIALTSSQTGTKLFDLASLKERPAIAGMGGASAVTFNASGGLLVLGNVDGQLSVWDLHQGTMTRSISAHSGYVAAVAMQTDNLLFSMGVDRFLQAIDIVAGSSLGNVTPSDAMFTSLAVHPDGKTFVLGTSSGQIDVCSSTDISTTKTLTDSQAGIAALAFSPDGRTLVAGTIDGNVLVYDAATYSMMRQFPSRRGAVSSLTYDPKSRWLVCATADSTITLFDAGTSAPVASLRDPDGAVSFASFADEKTFLTANSKGQLKRWSVLPEPPDVIPPVIVLEKPKTAPDGAVDRVFGSQSEVSGIVYDNSGVAGLRVNGKPATLTAIPPGLASKVPAGMKGQAFTATVRLDSVGVNPFTLTATDMFGLTASQTVSLRRLTNDEALEVLMPSQNADVAATSTPVRFRAWFDIASYSLSVNLIDVVRNQSVGFKSVGDEISDEVPLVLGYNQIQLTVVSTNGDQFTKNIGVSRASGVTSGPSTSGPVTKRDKESGPQAWAVVVGVSEYANPGIPALKYADRDAEAFASYLRRPEGGGYDANHLRVLLNKDATLGNVRDALINFLNQAIDIDLVVIYFAGHGAPEPARPQNLYLLTYDSDPGVLGTTAFPMWQIQDVLARYISAKRIVVFSDACHSGGISVNYATRGLGVTDQNLINQYLTDLSKTHEGTVVFTASAAGEVSQEFPELGHGVFTYYMLEGLEGKADYNNDYTITINELMQYVEEQVKRKTHGAQNPTRSQTSYDKELTIATVPH